MMISDQQLIEDAGMYTKLWCRQYQVNFSWRDDILSEVYIALHEARERFNPEKASWKFYAGLRSKSAVIEFLRRQIPYQQRNSFIIDKPWSNDEGRDDGGNWIESRFLNCDDDQTMVELKELLSDIKPKYREVVLCLVSGMTQTEISKRLNLSVQRIGELVDDLRKGLAKENLK